MFRVFALALMFVASSVLAETRDINQYFFDQKLGDFKAELETAKKEGKQGILLMFEMDARSAIA